jgi:hypothetical protein
MSNRLPSDEPQDDENPLTDELLARINHCAARYLRDHEVTGAEVGWNLTEMWREFGLSDNQSPARWAKSTSALLDEFSVYFSQVWQCPRINRDELPHDSIEVATRGTLETWPNRFGDPAPSGWRDGDIYSRWEPVAWCYAEYLDHGRRISTNKHWRPTDQN